MIDFALMIISEHSIKLFFSMISMGDDYSLNNELIKIMK